MYKTVIEGDTITVLKEGKKLKGFSNVPKSIIEEVAKFYNYCLYGETDMNTGKPIYKVGRITNETGGVVNLYTTGSRAEFNRFILEGKL